jgi:RIO-like serine/threonine protein kinase
MSLAPNRLLRHWRARFGIRKRVRELTVELKSVFPNLDELVPSAHWGGFDSIYFLEDAACQRFGVLRLNNPHQKRKAVHTDLPRRSPAPAERIDREWQAYSVLAPLGLSPRPLWRSHDAVVCAHSPHLSFRKHIEAGSIDSARGLEAILNAVGQMHEVGIAHLDLSPANVLVCPNTFETVLIDFEYVPLAGRSFEDDCAHDWRLMIGRLRKRAAILVRLDQIEADIAAAVAASRFSRQIQVALSESANTLRPCA